MSHEEIVATVDFILDRDEELVGGDIEFKRAFLEKEADVFFAICNQARSVFQSCSFPVSPVSESEDFARSLLRLRFLTILLHGIWFYHRIGLTDPAN
jgi:hypothetical protein